MSKKNLVAKKGPEILDCPIMKSLEQSMAINSFQTHFRFTNDLGLELLKGAATSEHIKVLKRSIEGIKQFINLIEEKIKERKDK